MKIMIVEDEFPIAQLIQKHVKDILGTQLTQLVVFASLEQAQEHLKIHSIDVLLLDLNLNGKNGFEMLQSLVAESFHTIIISAYRDRALEAFEYGVLDFVPKPFNKTRLEKAFNRLQTEARSDTKFLAIKHQGRIELIPIEDIVYAQGAGNYSEVYLQDGRKVLHDKALDKLRQLLPANFERIHKSYVVKMSEMQSVRIHQGSKYEMVLKSGAVLPIGRTKYKDLKERWL
ncbi:MAG TPA: DNA-binding response regulator [Microscillaceae bacterium]|nr:DNA-binding response regulator [Microscillaceae bacterium]